MAFRHVLAVGAVLCASLFLSGCFVVATHLPTGTGPIADERLVGAWRGFDADDKKDADAFLHFLEPDRDEPLKLVWVEGRNYQVYEVRTMVIGGKNVFAAKLLTPPDGAQGEIPDGYYLGFYEVKDDEVVFNLLDSEKIGDLIAAGKLKGTRPPGKYEIATLTGSPEALAAFLASPEAQAARAGDDAVIHRITRAKKEND